MKRIDMALAQWASVLTLVISAVFMVVGVLIGQPAVTLVFTVFAIAGLLTMTMPKRRATERARDDQLPR